MGKADIALIGLAVMGENLILNLENKGFTVSCYNRTVSKVDRFIQGRARGKNIIGRRSIPELIATLSSPRKVMLMVQAGAAVDFFIEQIIPHLQPGDMIIDGGNSNFQDAIRRTEYIENQGMLYIGTGISGGEEGALRGPSIMPGGSINAWKSLKPIFQKIAAHTDDDQPCCQWVGPNGAGHFVKMVHNGIEYGDMQIICESYHLLKQVLGLSNSEMGQIYDLWNHGELKSYLIEITRDIL
ncbi:MAG: NADP-dependent phosphogluconate dehydrogenase, partial [Planctomycetes bacterium]|nr:NADP-dependent phosphogluconate dehydrogenase [Planctomycetota bacterium]